MKCAYACFRVNSQNKHPSEHIGHRL